MGKNAKPKLSMKADLERQERIKTLVIISLFSDDDLMNRFVLKGGNALDIVYNVSTRASIDVDVSIFNGKSKGLPFTFTRPR
jgi:predicted nucleotidyltransferase component of viral defense system